MECYKGNHPKLKKIQNLILTNNDKLNAFNYFNYIDDEYLPVPSDIVEVAFKNGRKEYFRNVNKLDLTSNTMVVVEAQMGFDVGTVLLTGMTAYLQFRKKPKQPPYEELRKVIRIARLHEIEKLNNLRNSEHNALMKTRKIIEKLGLIMKLIDVEYQGDGTKATFYYTAEERVDFRELIKILAEEFRCRIEMKQIGVRQEAARLGGIGSCGRELCCANWLTNFTSVSTNSAKVQQIAINPQKLAGQCAKLKCCLNFEYDNYYELQQNCPDTTIILKTQKGEAIHQKTELLKGIMWYSYKDEPNIMIPLSIEYVKKVIEMNNNGQLPEQIEDESLNIQATLTQKNEFTDIIDENEINKLEW